MGKNAEVRIVCGMYTQAVSLLLLLLQTAAASSAQRPEALTPTRCTATAISGPTGLDWVPGIALDMGVGAAELLAPGARQAEIRTKHVAAEPVAGPPSIHAHACANRVTDKARAVGRSKTHDREKVVDDPAVLVGPEREQPRQR